MPVLTWPTRSVGAYFIRCSWPEGWWGSTNRDFVAFLYCCALFEAVCSRGFGGVLVLVGVGVSVRVNGTSDDGWLLHPQRGERPVPIRLGVLGAWCRAVLTMLRPESCCAAFQSLKECDLGCGFPRVLIPRGSLWALRICDLQLLYSRLLCARTWRLRAARVARVNEGRLLLCAGCSLLPLGQESVLHP